MSKFDLAIKYFANVLGWFGAACIFAMCFLTFVNAVLRKLPLEHFILGVVGISEILIVCVAFFTLALVFYQGQHVAVMILVDRLPRGLQEVLRSVTLFISAALWAVVTWKLSGKALWAIHVREMRFGVINVPIWPGRIVATLGSAALCIALISALLSNFTDAKKK